MCGITGGVWSERRRAIEPETLRRMIAAVRHRGPDEQGEHWSVPATLSSATPGVALGHARLSIIDLAGGRQPLANEVQTVWVVLNGEIYNYRALRRQLEAAGHRFQTQSDTETLVHLYEERGVDFLEAVDGMFALALWDARQGQLLLARDRLGEKPLVYREEPGRLLFASELKSLLAAPGVPRELDPQALDEYLTYQYVPHPRTIFRGVAKLPPGHLAVYRDGRLDVRPYWQPDFSQEDRRPAAEWGEELRTRLAASVAARLQSDVPLGAFLSGGIDSTIMVGLARQATSGPLRTFSIGFSSPEYDETRFARLVAERFETEHEEFRVTPDALSILPDLARTFDEPFADSSAVPTWFLAQLTRRQVTVALTGDGGDELFGGYRRYRAVWLADCVDRLPWPVRQFLSAPWWQTLPSGRRQKSLLRQAQRFLDALGKPPVERYLDWVSFFNAARRAALYRPEFAAQLTGADSGEFLRAAWGRAHGRDAVTAASLTDLITYLPGDLLQKVDMTAMAHALECRPPFLDHRVVELAARMPRECKLHWGRGKRLLRTVFADLLPPAVERRGKMGFGAPVAEWFRGELRDFARQTLLGPSALAAELFRAETVKALLDEHQARRFDHSARLWALLMLELWAGAWLRGGGS